VSKENGPQPAVIARAGAQGGTVVVVTADVRADAVHIGLAGEVDASNASCLHEALSKLDTGRARVCIDLSTLTFVDCAGLAMLRALVRETASVRLEGIAHPSVRRIFELTGAVEHTGRH
jgi:anti-anti-sigma factor